MSVIGQTPSPDPNSSDYDNDGIYNEIDLEPFGFSDDFSDVTTGATTHGTILDRGDQIITISDEPNPKGVRIILDASGGTTPAQISMCGITEMSVFAGSEMIITCGSVAWNVISGQVQAILIASDGSTAQATLDTGDSFFFDDQTFTMKSNVGTANIVISSNDGTTAQIVLNDGNAVTYDSSTSILSAVDDNPTDVIMIIDGQESFIAPGSTDIVNIPPIVEQIVSTLEPTQIGTMISASANFIDQGITDTHVATWDWGDGTASSGIVSETNGSGSVTGEHQYTTSGTFTITLTVTDNDEESGNSDFRYVVIYNPEGGFVTGGGWIDSPVGADIANPDETGKANFGFVSKYKKGASEPTGQTEFYFDAGNLNFHSTSYEWLVVANAKAQYKGDGTINGQGSYKFMLTAIDSDVNQNDSHDTDKFRIIIWDDTGLRYDNQVNETDENADPTTVIGGGNIKIHKEK